MKAIKTNLTQSGTNLYIKALIAGTTIGSICILLLLCVLSVFILITGTLPVDMLVWFGIALGCISSCFSGYTASRITKVNGMIIGSCSGAIIFIILFVAGLIKGDVLSLITLIKSILFTLCGAIGGIKGVNKKEKLHIK